MAIQNWMSWEGGVDLVAMTQSGLEQPNIIAHVARMVHTPVGSAPSCMILIPGEDGAPQLMGFVSSDPQVGAYFGPHIFAGTPFENAPVLTARFDFSFNAPDSVGARIEVEGHVIESQLSQLGELTAVDWPASTLPFRERSLAASAQSAKLSFDGTEISLTLPPAGMSGGPAAMWAACGMYWR